MKMNSSVLDHNGFPFLPEIRCHCDWLYYRFSLRFRDIEELMVERGIVLTYANALRRRHPRCGDKWYIDETMITIYDNKHSLR